MRKGNQWATLIKQFAKAQNLMGWEITLKVKFGMYGRNPKMKLMQISHNTELATRFGSKVRN